MTSRKEGFWAIKAAIFLSTLMASSQLQAHAQRTMSGQNNISLCAYSPLSNIKDYGGEIHWGQYMLNSHWRIEASGCCLRKATQTGHILETCNITLGGSYMHRLAGTRSRSVSLYAGGGAFIGYEFFDPSGRLPEYISTGLAKHGFLYGIHATTEAEFFVCRNVALVLYASIPINFSSPLGMVRFKTGGGIRINI